jgi:gamma-glutamyltranspeptidase / glutathione hydrolase
MQSHERAAPWTSGVTKTPILSPALLDRAHGRSMVMSSRGIVASEHPLASQAGAMILAHGGHAVDAAIAANAVMGVVAPMLNGVGGDLFAIVHDGKTGRLDGVNASGWAPASLTLDVLRDKGYGLMPQGGIHSVTVPGAVAGWELLAERFGQKPFSEILEPAIAIAEEGFPVPEMIAAEWAASENDLGADSNAAKTFLQDGRAPGVGEIFRNPSLAWTYRQIVEGGTRSFYRGDIADRVVACSDQQGGLLTATDLAEFTAHWVEPISTSYRGWNVYELPPNGQGIAALMMLNILENFPLREAGPHSIEGMHTMIEAKKLAYADMNRYVADPTFGEVPMAAMLSKTYGRMRAKLIDPTRANGHFAAGTLPPRGGDTTYLSVVDGEGNMVSLIQSNFSNFGSKLVPEGTGFALQNRGALFTLDPTHPNVLAPRKRPLHTIIPGFMSRRDVRIAFGIMGGWNQAQAHVQFVSNVVDHGMNIQEALEAPRFTKLTFSGCGVLVEVRVSETVRKGLSRKGHEVQVQGPFSSAVGGGQSVMRNFATRVNAGASDPRKDGAAVPEPIRLQ